MNNGNNNMPAGIICVVSRKTSPAARPGNLKREKAYALIAARMTLRMDVTATMENEFQIRIDAADSLDLTSYAAVANYLEERGL